MAPQRIEPGVYQMDLPCPQCHGLVETVVELGCVLTIPDDDTPTLKVRAKSVKVPHWCGQGVLFDPATGEMRA